MYSTAFLDLPPLTGVLHMAPLSAGLLGIALAGAAACLLWFEVLRVLARWRVSGRA